MAIVYYVIPGQATSVLDDSYMPVPDAPWVSATEEEYQQELADYQKNVTGDLTLKVSRSTIRANPHKLQGNTIDDGRSYAVWFDDEWGLDISQVEFVLDEIHHNTEFSAPWDFNGTDVGDDAIKYIFPPGTHEIDAHITYAGGALITLTATFEVD